MSKTKAFNPIMSTLKGKVTLKPSALDQANAVRGTVKGDLGLSKTRKTDYGKGQTPAHKAYMEQFGPLPKDKPRGVRRVDKTGIDDYTE